MTRRILDFNRAIVPQQYYWDCGPASTEVVLDALGKRYSEDTLIRMIGTHTGGTDYVGLIERALNRILPEAKYVSVYLPNDPPTRAQVERLWADVRQSIDRGYGCVLNWVSPVSNRPRAVLGTRDPAYPRTGVVYHYVACVGYDDAARALFIADPGFSPMYPFFVTVEQAASLITPKGYTYSAGSAVASAAPTPTLRFTTIDRPSAGRTPRTARVTNFILHTQEGDSSAESLAKYCDGSRNVSYHYTLRDGILCRLVDPKLYASWSVLSANPFTINLCFAGSHAKWTRQQWLARERDIEIAAFVAVRDCREAGVPVDVIRPPYTRVAAGITDHRYVTQALKVGTHLDVGDGFPWDRLQFHIDRFTKDKDDFMSELTAAEQREMLTLLRVLAKTRFPSRSPLRHLGEGPIDTVAGFDLNQDANLHILTVMELARAGVQSQLDLLREIAGADPRKHPDRVEDAKLARKLLAQLEAEASTSGRSDIK